MLVRLQYIYTVSFNFFSSDHSKSMQQYLDTSKYVIRNVSKFLGSREESEVAGFFVFSHIRMMGYFRSG